jgi:hypothetical protein
MAEAEGGENDECVLEEVVIEGPASLGEAERPEAACHE